MGVINHVNVFMNNKLNRFRTSCTYICADACNPGSTQFNPLSSEPGSTQFNPLSTEPGSTRVVVRTRLEYHVFTFNGLPIQHTSEYKYLGVLLTSNSSLKSAISTLALQADKAAFSLKRKVTLLHYPKPSTIVRIYKALIRPITEYASEVWGYYKSDVLERGHRHFGKFILGLPSSACNAAVYGELGTFPLDLRKKIRMVKYWLTQHIATTPEGISN